MPAPDARGPLVGVAAALVVTALVAALGLEVSGHDPLRAASALVSGAFGSREAFVSITLVRSVPLILTGLAVALAFRAGVWNIGAEGQLYAGAVAVTWLGLVGAGSPGWVLLPVSMAAALVAGAAWALIPALMKARLGVGEVITTILMNFLAIHLAAWMVHGPLQESRGVFPQSDPIVEAARLPVLPGSRLHLGFAVAIALGAALWVVLGWSRVGFQVRALGASPEAARVAGRIDTGRLTLAAFLASGAVAGLAGGVEVSGVTYALYEGLSPGWGYTAIAVALLARLHPLWVVVAGLLFGALEGGAGAMQREAGVPAAWVSAVEALVILALLAADAVREHAQTRSADAPGEDGRRPPPDAAVGEVHGA